MAVAAPAREVMRVSGEPNEEGKSRHTVRKVIATGKDKAISLTQKDSSCTKCSHCAESQRRQDGLRRIGYFLSATIDALAGRIVVLDSDGTIVASNAAWRRFAKENQGDEQTCGVGSNYLSVCQIAAEHGVTEADAVATGIRHVLSQQQQEFSLTYACHSQTEERWFTVRVSGFEYDEVRWAVVTHDDVTALQKREQALKQREEWFRSLNTSSPIGIFQTNAAGHYVYTNPRWQEIYGLTVTESLGNGWTRTIHPKDRQSVHTAWEGAAREGKEFCRVFRIVTPTSTPRWVRVHCQPMRGNNGETIGAVGTTEDITASKQAEEALRRSEERWQLALQGANEGIWDWKVQSNDLFFSPRLKEMIGFAEHEVPDRFDYWIDRVHPDDVGNVMQEIRDHFSRKVPFYTVECRLRCRNDTYRWVLVRGQALWDDAGYVIRMVGSISDITERKQVEEEKAAFAEKVMESNRALQEFASVASHDLQEPLRKIQAFGEQLRSAHSRELSEEGRDYLQRLLNATDRMRTLINDLLALSQVTTKARPMVSIDLTQVAREVVGDLEVRVAQSNGHVEVGELPTIEADPLQMRQMLQNLIGNALKFRRKDVAPVVNITGKIIAETASCEIRVEDNGIGFDIKYLSRIFAPFQRLHTRQQYEGSGMGLAICRKIVERHRGKITASSAPGQGAIFIISLPVKQGGATER
jgi:PAS domain S-box-containing protein